MTRFRVACLGVLIGLCAVVAGVVVVFGVAWALIVGGAACVASSALLVDVEEGDGESSSARP